MNYNLKLPSNKHFITNYGVFRKFQKSPSSYFMPVLTTLQEWTQNLNSGQKFPKLSSRRNCSLFLTWHTKDLHQVWTLFTNIESKMKRGI